MANSFTSFSRFIKYAKPWKVNIYIATFYSIINKLFDIAPEILIGIAVDLVVQGENSFIANLGFPDPKSQITFLAICTFSIWAFESLFQYLYSISWRKIAQSIEHAIRINAYSHVQLLDLSWFENQKTGDITAKLNDDVNQLERFLDNGLNEIIQIIVSSIAIGCVFFYISPLIACISIIPIPLILLVAFLFQKNLAPKYTAVREAVGKMNNTIFNNLIGISTIKSFVTESLESKRVEILSLDYQMKNKNAIMLSSAFIPIVRMGVLSGFLATMIIGSLKTLNGEIAVGSFSVLVFLTQRFLWPFTRLGETVDLFERSMASNKRILDLIDTPYEIKNNNKSFNLDNYKQDLIFENISFSYTKHINVFTNLNMKIKSGDFVGIVGQTGAGKTTIIKLLLRFYNIQNGNISIGNKNIKNININNLRENIGYVSQEIFLFDGTIRENICYPESNVNNSALEIACKKSQASEFINKLPDKYETLIGERGQKLSVGQKQRIAIARAIYKNPPIIIFDEATSAVDNETELLIQKALHDISQDRTTIVIAHRLSTIRNANKIFVIGENNIIEFGNHNELIELKGAYEHLWNIQTGER